MKNILLKSWMRSIVEMKKIERDQSGHTVGGSTILQFSLDNNYLTLQLLAISSNYNPSTLNQGVSQCINQYVM